ncbi:MAG: hypothetical protein WCB85_05140 [Candidatus Dormiibacterota bacterium]
MTVAATNAEIQSALVQMREAMNGGDRDRLRGLRVQRPDGR